MTLPQKGEVWRKVLNGRVVQREVFSCRACGPAKRWHEVTFFEDDRAPSNTVTLGQWHRWIKGAVRVDDKKRGA